MRVIGWSDRCRLGLNDGWSRGQSWIVRLTPLVVLFFSLESITLAAGPEILGVRMGMTRAELKDTFNESGIPTSELGPRGVSAPGMPVFLDGVREVRLSFEKEQLKKIVVLFWIPPREPTATALIGNYEKEKERLKQLFGAPATDLADLQAPRPEDRYEWLARGRGHYRTIWKNPEIVINLWLYAEDDGLVFQEIYEGQ